MRQKSLTIKSSRIFVRAVLLGMLLIIPATAYAEAFSLTSVSFGNLQITDAAGSVIQFGVWQARANAMANNNLGQAAAPPQANSNGGIAQAIAIVNFATGNGIADAANMTLSAQSQVDAIGCNCLANAGGQAGLSNTFTVIGPNGNALVTISGLFLATQAVLTNQFGLIADSDATLDIFVDNIPVFSFDSSLHLGGPNAGAIFQIPIELAQAVTVQLNVPHTIDISIRAISSGLNQVPPGAADVPEPTTAVLLFSGLGFMTGLIKKRRQLRR
jgi:hypothetical protein